MMDGRTYLDGGGAEHVVLLVGERLGGGHHDGVARVDAWGGGSSWVGGRGKGMYGRGGVGRGV